MAEKWTGDWVDHVIGSIQTPLYDPFPFAISQDTFPIFPGFYDTIIENFQPMLSIMPVLNPAKPQRRLLELSDNMTGFWGEFAAMLLGPKLRDHLCAKFGIIGGGTGAQLIHDDPGYFIGPHTDIDTKVLTGLFYLPRSAGLNHTASGLGLYVSKSGQESDGWQDFPFSEDFERKAHIPYVKNMSMFFPRTNWSFHAVEKTPSERWVIAYDIYK